MGSGWLLFVRVCIKLEKKRMRISSEEIPDI
jgi:hypothetical protein